MNHKFAGRDNFKISYHHNGKVFEAAYGTQEALLEMVNGFIS